MIIFYLMLIQNKLNTVDTNKSGCGQHGNTVYPLPSRFDCTIKRNLIVYSRLCLISPIGFKIYTTSSCTS